jgi:hypothetical protein
MTTPSPHQDEPITEQMQERVEGVVKQAQEEVTRSHEPWYRVSRRTIVLIIAYMIVFVLFLLLAWFVHVHPIL